MSTMYIRAVLVHSAGVEFRSAHFDEIAGYPIPRAD